jgi:hypothetical protein
MDVVYEYPPSRQNQWFRFDANGTGNSDTE